MKILICGAFGFKQMLTGGQPVKTRELYYLLCNEYGKENIEYIETKGWKKNPLKLILELFKKTKRCDALIMLPAHNGVEVFGRIFSFIKKKTGKKIFYDVIGGWLPEKLEKEPKLKKVLENFDGIWVETSSMKSGLENCGLNNITVVPNFKDITPVEENDLDFSVKFPLKLCTFSRVMKEKGIEDAVNAVTEINKSSGKTLLSLDIYGQIFEPYAERFEEIIANSPDYITYKGCVSPNKSVETLKDYFALLFPTHYYTEGIPGTLIDAYAAGVPVITALWKNYSDVFEKGKTGWAYEIGDYNEFAGLLERLVKNPEEFSKMKSSALEFFDRYTPKNAVSSIKKLI